MRHFLPCLLLVAACSAGGATTTTAPTTSTSESAVTSTSVPATTSTTSPSTTTTIDPVATFNSALAASSANYRFVSSVTSGDQTITSIAGIVDQDSVAADITTGTSVVSYVRTPEGEWITDSEGEWVDVEGAPPINAPLSVLGDSTALDVVSSDSSTSILSGVLGPAAGNASGIPYTITIQDGLVVEISYEAETTGQVAMVVTTLSEIGTAGIVTRPEGA